MLFTPRVGSRYCYEQLWVALVTALMIVAGVFFGGFALRYVADLLGAPLI